MKEKMLIGVFYIIEITLLLLSFFLSIPGVIKIIGIVFMIVLTILTTKINNSIKDWKRYIKKWDNPELTFEEFYSLYSIMPEKFQLNRFEHHHRRLNFH